MAKIFVRGETGLLTVLPPRKREWKQTGCYFLTTKRASCIKLEALHPLNDIFAQSVSEIKLHPKIAETQGIRVRFTSTRCVSLLEQLYITEQKFDQ